MTWGDWAMRQRNKDLYVAMGIAVMNITGAFFPTHLPAVSIILALPLIFFLPGYTLIEMLAHKYTLATSHRIIFSLGLSITLDCMGGFLLNVLPSGLRTQSWAVLLGCATLLLALLTLLLRRGTTPIESTLVALELGSLLRGGVLFCLAAVLIVVTLIYATNGVTQQSHTGFTQLWMIPPTSSGQNCIVRLGVHSFEKTPVTFHATLSVNSVREVVWPSIALSPNQVWEQPILVPANTAHAALIEVKLYKGNDSTSVYRQVHITLRFNATGKMNSCA